MPELIEVEQDEGLAIVRLNRPDKLNSLNMPMREQLVAAMLSACSDPDVRAILLTATGRGFCTGQDLAERDPAKLSGPPDLQQSLEQGLNPLVTAMRAAAKPIVGAVNGVAAGAGANLALACDIVIAANSARFIQSFTHVGLIPDAGGSWMLPHLIGEARAKAIALTGIPVTATDAVAMGMIWQAVADEELQSSARDLALALARGPTRGHAETKRVIQAAANNSLSTHLELEAQIQGHCGRSADYAEGVSAFLAKRKPNYSGQ